MIRISIIISGLLLTVVVADAQDTIRKKEVNITSTFKPSLKEAAKININAAPPVADTTLPKLQYSIPNQNLSFLFQPGVLKPLALDVDSGGKWPTDNYVKLGYGNFKTPFAQAGFSFGDGKNKGVNIYAKHFSSKGKIELQEMAQTNINLKAFFKTSNDLEWNAALGGMLEKYNKYGNQPKPFDFPEDSFKVKFKTFSGRIGLRNINLTQEGLGFAPEIKVDAFSDREGNSESNSYISVPLYKPFGTTYALDVKLEANISRYTPEEKDKVTNNWFAFSPTLHYRTSNLTLHAGLRPAWENKNFNLFPNLMAELTLPNGKFSIQAGWTGYLKYAGYQQLAAMNPWIFEPLQTYVSSVVERFGGFKGSVGDHINYGAKVAFNTIKNQPLFFNDTMGGGSFIVLNEPEMNVLNIGGELGYTVGEKFSLITTLSMNQFTTDQNKEAWGLLPLEFNSKLRLQLSKDLYANVNLYAFDGPQSLSKQGSENLKGSADLSAGLEFKVLPRVKVWMQANNILGQEYERWNQYPVYGLNFLAGVVLSFAQNK